MPNNPIAEPSLTPPPTVDDAGSAPLEDTTKSKSNTYVQFTQLTSDPLKGSHRVIYKHDWKSVGIDQEDVTFGPVNGYRVAVESLKKDAIERLLKEPDFSKVELDKDGNVKADKE